MTPSELKSRQIDSEIAVGSRPGVSAASDFSLAAVRPIDGDTAWQMDPAADPKGKEASGVCANCGRTRQGRFCSQCGEKHHDDRLELRQLLGDLFSKLVNWESGLLHTFVNLWTRPGAVCLDYINGKRKPYVNPLSYFLLAAAMQIFSLWLITPILKESMIAGINVSRNDEASRKNFEAVDRLMGGDAGSVMAEIYVSTMLQVYTYASFLFFSVPLAAALWLLHKHEEPHYRFAEVLIFSLYIVAHNLIITAVISPLFCFYSTTLHAWLCIAIYFGLILWAHQSFFQSNWKSRVFTVLSMLFACFVFFVSIVAIFTISFVAQIMWLKMYPPSDLLQVPAMLQTPAVL